ncbi:sugar phosphate nucleotidyltransferase [Streptomyces sp. NPDC006739]|uniref:sugar phosphate nucleotidyltransferase n=1 Tax=Streptomyces sp. NPDC006739 TaxID=3364763 RepID=UPI0036C8A875
MRTAGVILAAGAGSRMRPLTHALPKPLVPVLDRPLLLHLVDRMAAAGAQEIFVNLHHHAEQIQRVLDDYDCPVLVRTEVEPELTGPAGALTRFADRLRSYDAVLVTSGDVLSGDDLAEVRARHQRSDADLTVAAVRRQGARHFGVLDIGDDSALTGAREKPPVPDEEWHWVSAGIYCLSAAAIDRIPRGSVFDYAADLVPLLLSESRTVVAARLNGYWRDIGTPRSLREANLDAAAGRIPWLAPRGTGEGVHIGSGAHVAGTAVLRGPVVIGSGARIGEGTWLENSVVLSDSVIPAGTVLIDALAVTPA